MKKPPAPIRKPLTAADLDRAQCSAPGCTHEDHTYLFLHNRCHPRAGSNVAYNMITKTLTVRCRHCERFSAEIAVAHGP